MKTITTLLLALCFFGQAHAIDQPSESSSEIPLEQKQASILLNADTYSVPEGLSQSTVTSLVEDKDGYVWIGTLNGLNRFDGKDFKNYFSGERSGLPSSFIRSLLIDSKGNLLVGTNKGLSIYNPDSETFEPLLKGNKNITEVWSMLETKNNFYLGNRNQLLKLDKKLSRIIKSSNITGDDEIKEIINIGDAIIIRTYSGAIYKTDDNFLNKEIIVNQSNSITSDDEYVYITTNSGTFSYKNSLKNISNKKFDSLYATENILFGIKNTKLYKIKTNKIIPIGTVNKLSFDSEKSHFSLLNNNFYISEKNSGLTIISNLENLISSINISNTNVWSFSKNNDNIIVSSDSKYINTYNDKLSLVQTFDSGINGFKNTILIDSFLYIGSLKGLQVIDTDTKSVKLISDKIITTLYKSETNEIIAGTADGEIITISNGVTISVERITEQQPIFDITKLNGIIYIASQDGMYSKTKNKKIKISSGLIYSVTHLNNSVIFGTTTSLNEYNPKTRSIVTLFSNNKAIYSIEASNKSIVASSQSEVVVIVNKKTLILDTSYGSQHEYNVPSSITLNDGSVLLGGLSGVSKLNPNKILEKINHQTGHKTNLSTLSVFNVEVEIGTDYLSQSLSTAKRITLKYSDYPFTLEFNSGHYKNSTYSYQLQGLSNDWITTQNINSATYTNLSPGEYLFKVYSIDKLTHAHGPIKNIIIEITPPWWLSRQAKFIYFMLSLIISAVIVKSILRRREVQNQIAKSEERLKLSLWGSGDEMWDWDIETGQIYRSNIWGSLEFPRDGQRSGETGEESNIHPMDQERVSTALNDHFYGKSDHFEAAYRVKGKSGDWVWILDRAKIVERDEKDNPLRMTGTIKNINNFKHAEEQLRLFERAIANISEGMFILDSEFRFVEVNEACCELCLKPKDKFIGEQFNFDLYPDSYSEQIRTILNQQGRWSNDVESAKGDGSSFLMELTVDAIYDEQGQLTHYVGVFSDISRRKQQEEELRKLTNNDLLTNLPNRSSLMVTLGNLVKRDSHHTLMVLDLDNFKKINDSLGHQVGDELLIKVARRIEAAVPYHTSIYRLGGDEFAILVDDNPDIGSSAVIANGVIEAFVTPFELTSDKVVVGMSIGIVLYPEDDQNEQALLRKADIAMYHAKSAGGNRYQFYSESLNRNAIRQLEVENLIRQGIKEDLFEVYYQPKIDLKSGKMAGMEALVRLNHPEQGLIPPSEFIPLAEENGLIVEIGDIVMKKACFAAQKWRSQGIFNGRVAVNLSSHQFALPDLQQRIESILRLTQLPAANLELEITEGTVIKEPEKAIKVMQQLSKMGVTLALDDFGTGYSSLSYLKRFPIHTLKIDKAFVDDIDKSDRDLKMVDSIITIAHNMGLSVVGEGVEDASQLSILKALNCEEIQGFIFSKPVSEAEFTKLLHKEFIEPDLVQNGKKAI